MENKVLVKLLVPALDRTFDLFIPVNEMIWKANKLMVKSISDLTGVSLNIKDTYFLINKNKGTVYNNNDVIIDTDIRNGTELVMLCVVAQVA